MPRDERSRQKKLLKRKQKAKVAIEQKNAQSVMKASLRTFIRKARKYPIIECLINEYQDESNAGLVRIVIARQQPDGNVAYGFYLIDMFCLGLKNTFCNAGYSFNVYRDECVPSAMQPALPKECPVDLAHQIIYQAMDYAAQFGFKPPKDYKWSNYLLEERGTLEEPYELTFGKDGKPLYVAGPYDNVDEIVSKLETNAGPGNYDYVALPGGSVEGGEFFDGQQGEYDGHDEYHGDNEYGVDNE